jgi:hypothetical protein
VHGRGRLILDACATFAMVEVMVAMSSSTAEVLRKGVRGRRHSVLESLALKSSLSICGGDGTGR